MTLKTPPATLDTFLAWISQPQNDGKLFELIQGEFAEKMGSNQKTSRIAFRIGRLVGNFVEEKSLGRITGADGMYQVGEDVLIPDVGYISLARQPTPSADAVNPLAPDLAIEVISPTDREQRISVKLATYLAAGVIVWEVWPEEQEVVVYHPGQPPRILGLKDTLEGGTLLPGFVLPVASLFAEV